MAKYYVKHHIVDDETNKIVFKAGEIIDDFLLNGVVPKEQAILEGIEGARRTGEVLRMSPQSVLTIAVDENIITFISSLNDSVASDSINTNGYTSYSITNKPAWLSLDANTGDITISPDGTLYGKESFDIILSNESDNVTIENGLIITLHRDQTEIVGRMSSMEPLVEIPEASIKGTGLDGLIFAVDGAGGWNAVIPYYGNKTSNLKVVSLSNGAELQNSPDYTSDAMNGTSWTVASDGNTHVRSTETLHKFNTSTDTFELAMTFPVSVGGGSYKPMSLATDGKLIVAGANNNEMGLIEIDVSNYSYKEYLDVSNGFNDMNPRSVSADSTHCYITTTNSGDGHKLFSINRTTNATTLLGEFADWTFIYQVKYGTYLTVEENTSGLTEGKYYLYNGTLTLALDFGNPNDSSIPWSNNGEDLTDTYLGNTTQKLPEIVDSTNVIPETGTTTGKLWFKNIETDPWDSVTINNIVTYNLELRDVGSVQNKIVVMGTAYNGYSIYDSSTLNWNSYQMLENDFSYYSSCVANGKLYMTGYPSGALVEFDPSKPWDNKVSNSYHPDSAPTVSNPKFIGYTRGEQGQIPATGGGQHATFACDFNQATNTLWVAGEYRRDGVGGGITKVDLSNNYSMTGIAEASMADLPIFEGCLTDNYAVYSCIRLSNEQIALTIINMSNDSVRYFDLPVGYVASGRLVHAEDDSIILMSSFADDFTRFIKINVAPATPTIEWESAPTNLVSRVQNNDVDVTKQGKASLRRLSDKGIYAQCDNHLVLVDSETGLIEEGVNFDKIVRGHEFNSNMYVVDYDTAYKANNYLTPDGFIEIVYASQLVANTTFDTSDNWTMLGTNNITGGQLVIDGSRPIWNTIVYGNLTEPPLETETYVFSMDITEYTSGYMKVNLGGSPVEYSGVGTYSFTITDNSFTDVTLSNTDNPFIGKLDNITITKV